MGSSGGRNEEQKEEGRRGGGERRRGGIGRRTRKATGQFKQSKMSRAEVKDIMDERAIAWDASKRRKRKGKRQGETARKTYGGLESCGVREVKNGGNPTSHDTIMALRSPAEAGGGAASPSPDAGGSGLGTHVVRMHTGLV